MIRQVLIEARRWVSATAVPALVLVAVVAVPRSLDLRFDGQHAAAVAVWVVAVGAALAWLTRAVVVAALQPRRDRRASERLRLLRVGSHAPGRMLVAIQQVQWVGPAGQRVLVLDVARGTQHDLWLSEVALPVGSFAVLDLTAQPVGVVDWLDRGALAQARRHEARAASRHRSRAFRLGGSAARREKAAAAAVIREAERLLRSP